MEGQSLPMLGTILGHTQAENTTRCAHLADNSLQGSSIWDTGDSVPARFLVTPLKCG